MLPAKFGAAHGFRPFFPKPRRLAATHELLPVSVGPRLTALLFYKLKLAAGHPAEILTKQLRLPKSLTRKLA